MRPRRCLTPLALAVALAPAACTTASASPGPDQQIYGGTAWTTRWSPTTRKTATAPSRPAGSGRRSSAACVRCSRTPSWAGEVGTNRGDRTVCKLATLNRYYRLRIDVPGYIGGYFWWYYAEDMVPYKDNVLWRSLSSVITSGGASAARGIPSSIKPDRT